MIVADHLYDRMRNSGYQSARKQHVSIHVAHKGIEVDLVPAKHLGGNTGDHWLYVNKSNRERTQTNVNNHINLVKKSGRVSEIILTKIWRQNHGLDFPSFYLELVVIAALKSKHLGLAKNFWSVLEYLSNNFLSARFIDPANSNNVVSDDLTNLEKKTIVSRAAQGMREQNWESIVW